MSQVHACSCHDIGLPTRTSLLSLLSDGAGAKNQDHRPHNLFGIHLNFIGSQNHSIHQDF